MIQARKKCSVKIVREFLNNVFAAMKLRSGDIGSKVNDSTVIEIELKGDDMEPPDRKTCGQTPQVLFCQQLKQILCNKKSDVYYRVKMDTVITEKRRKKPKLFL